MIPLEPYEDIKIYMSKFSKLPSPEDHQLEYQYQEEIVISEGA